ncbi:hypothetical protein KC363_g3385 [Hortaea werneckii]|uniref:Vesicle-mediated transporter Vid24 n=1 Tax=Hortaea werneckii TaxID=91943 RepID=A0A3M7FTY0_HORWE|nr:hypothetical protein KC361_g3472 [Hortaea werneckii]KAI6885374.1 hypothetical protein KC325_g3614 [Hortaea werneckii]KAI6995399.1 hypothetical protein KC359_g4098 [Hortaea werneckii]KAI7146841.1 hypothetical protein KC344_g3318 [Hortaea werneckii]KAI7175860.1 hypothetical protein KC360_g3370 [Hortaea werneckii]
MPTPSEPTLPPSPPVEASSSRASFASCPPEDDREREHHAPREERIGSPRREAGEVDEAHEHADTIHQEPTPEPELQRGLSNDIREAQVQVRIPQAHEKGEHVEDAGAEEGGIISPSATPDVLAGSENDAATLAQQSTQHVGRSSPALNEPLYLDLPYERDRYTPQITSSFLRPGSKFKGTQQSDRQVYDVQVEIKDVDMAESFLCGYLRIQGLTDDHPTLTTFFEGEIIGPKHLFKTTNPSWGSSEKVDLQHWARFPAWRPLARSATRNPGTFTLKNHADREHLFMRWKEYFLVPDHRVKSISGASFEGFYYICFNQVMGTVSGIYFHAKSEKYQQLELKHVDDRGCMPAMEFR